MKKHVLPLTLLALAPFALAACGGDDEGDSAATETSGDVNPSTEAIEVAAVPDGTFAFEQESLETEPGQLTVTFDNPAPIAHDFCVEDPGGEELGCTDLIADGDTDTAQFDLEPGEYTYFCSVAGHRDGGMEGTLTVN
jgi:plastocyanin